MPSVSIHKDRFGYRVDPKRVSLSMKADKQIHIYNRSGVEIEVDFPAEIYGGGLLEIGEGRELSIPVPGQIKEGVYKYRVRCGKSGWYARGGSDPEVDVGP